MNCRLGLWSQRTKSEQSGKTMKPAKRQVAILAEYIFDVGLSLSNKWDELFQTEFKPAFDAGWERRADEENWDGYEQELEKEMRAELAMGRERTKTKLVRLLRGFDLIAVGRADSGSLAIIHPRRWDRLVVTLGRNSVVDAEGTLRDVHIAPTKALGGPQRTALNELLYGLSAERVVGRLGDAPRTGRPRVKQMRVEKWVEAKVAEGKMPKTQSAAMSQAKKHFASLRGKEKISDETIRRVLIDFYSHRAGTTKPT
jgi:hypothetical protein